MRDHWTDRADQDARDERGWILLVSLLLVIAGVIAVLALIGAGFLFTHFVLRG